MDDFIIFPCNIMSYLHMYLIVISLKNCYLVCVPSSKYNMKVLWLVLILAYPIKLCHTALSLIGFAELVVFSQWFCLWVIFGCFKKSSHSYNLVELFVIYGTCSVIISSSVAIQR